MINLPTGLSFAGDTRVALVDGGTPLVSSDVVLSTNPGAVKIDLDITDLEQSLLAADLSNAATAPLRTALIDASNPNAIRISLGNVTNQNNDAFFQMLYLDFFVRVDNIASVDTADNFNVTADFFSGTLKQTSTPAAVEQIVEPNLRNLEKTVTDFDPNPAGTTGTATVTLAFTNSGDGIAYDAHLTDSVTGGSNYALRPWSSTAPPMRRAACQRASRYRHRGHRSRLFHSGDRRQHQADLHRQRAQWRSHRLDQRDPELEQPAGNLYRRQRGRRWQPSSRWVPTARRVASATTAARPCPTPHRTPMWSAKAPASASSRHPVGRHADTQHQRYARRHPDRRADGDPDLGRRRWRSGDDCRQPHLHRHHRQRWQLSLRRPAFGQFPHRRAQPGHQLCFRRQIPTTRPPASTAMAARWAASPFPASAKGAPRQPASAMCATTMRRSTPCRQRRPCSKMACWTLTASSSPTSMPVRPISR